MNNRHNGFFIWETVLFRVPFRCVLSVRVKERKRKGRDSIERKKNSICKLITVISFFSISLDSSWFYNIFVGTYACLDHDWTLLHACVDIQSIVVSLSGKEASFYFLYSSSSLYRIYKTLNIEKRKSLFVIVEFDLNKYIQSVSWKSLSGTTSPFFFLGWWTHFSP
jgi:Mg2+/citrate symporter